jgi:hypothetical protein
LKYPLGSNSPKERWSDFPPAAAPFSCCPAYCCESQRGQRVRSRAKATGRLIGNDLVGGLSRLPHRCFRFVVDIALAGALIDGCRDGLPVVLIELLDGLAKLLGIGSSFTFQYFDRQ